MSAARDSANVISAIDGRRSIRAGFDNRAVGDEVVAELLRCGCSAPSSKDAQHWRLHAVRDRVTLDGIADAMAASESAGAYVPLDLATGAPRNAFDSTVAASAEILRAVALGVFVEADGEFSGLRSELAAAPRPLLEQVLVSYSFELLGIGAAVQNMWIAAHALGLAGVFVGDVVSAEQHVRAALGMSGDLAGVLALGYSASSPWAERRVKPGRAVIHRGCDPVDLSPPRS